MATHDYQRFLDTFFNTGREAAMDGPDTGALSRLQGYEQDEAERMLIERLSVRDARPAIGLGVLRSQKGAAAVREMMHSLEGRETELEAGALVAISLACYRIDGDTKAIENIINVLENSPTDVFRQDAVIALRDSGAPGAEAAIWRAVEHDANNLVRHNAAKAILALHGKLANPRDPPDVTYKVMQQAPHIREEALRELRALLRG